MPLNQYFEIGQVLKTNELILRFLYCYGINTAPVTPTKAGISNNQAKEH
jgi:hypothetical protein